MVAMEPDLRELMELIRSFGPVPEGPVELSPEYLAGVAYIEGLPQNQSGSDKSWVWKAISQHRDFFARVVPQ